MEVVHSFIYLFAHLLRPSGSFSDRMLSKEHGPVHGTERAASVCWGGYEKATAISPKEKLEGGVIQLRASTAGLRSLGATQTEEEEDVRK